MKRKLSGKSAFFLSVMFFTCILSAGCKKSSTSQSPGANEVYMQNMAFNPLTLTVAVNTTVKWTNMDGYAHTVTSDSSNFFNSGNVNGGSAYSFQFTKAGTYAYHCNIHSNMHATVVVH
jgi:plastocyanin